MKTHLKSTLLLLCGLCLSVQIVRANNVGAPPQAHHETRLLQHLLEMDSQQLAQLRQTIERIEQMEPEEKERLRNKIGKMHDMPPERIDAMRKKYEAIPEEKRAEMRKRWSEMAPEERRALRDKFKAMSPEEREAALEENGFIPLPPRKDRKGPPRECPPESLEVPPTAELEAAP